jgi:solute carrier family 25 (mitochondrial citrate transporter), member 1
MTPQLLQLPPLAGRTTRTTVVIVGTRDEEEATVTRKASPALKAMAGSMGGLMEACSLQPIDTIKTRMQLNPALYPGVISSGSTIVKAEGTRSLWKGLTPFATHLYLKYALRFGTNAGFQSLLMDKETGKLDAPRRVLAGLGAGVTEVGREGGRGGRERRGTKAC